MAVDLLKDKLFGARSRTTIYNAVTRWLNSYWYSTSITTSTVSTAAAAAVTTPTTTATPTTITTTTTTTTAAADAATYSVCVWGGGAHDCSVCRVRDFLDGVYGFDLRYVRPLPTVWVSDNIMCPTEKEVIISPLYV